jgi:hypothetical protein
VEREPKKVAPAAPRVACPLYPSRGARVASSGKPRERGRRGRSLRWQREPEARWEMDGRESRRRRQPAGAPGGADGSSRLWGRGCSRQRLA